MTPHIEAKIDDIAPTVIMPGDPLRAKLIAETYLTDAKLVNSVRGMFAYTGKYKNKEVTVMASGMGMPSMGIYSYELYKYYNVENIIRVGTCGAYTENLKLKDVILVESSYSETTYDELVTGVNSPILNSSSDLNNKIKKAAKNIDINVISGRTHCSEAFYKNIGSIDKYFYEYNCIGVEMEAYALFQNANIHNKKAACILTVSDSLITGEATTSEERQNSFLKMIELALETASII